MNSKIIVCLLTAALLSIAPFLGAQQAKKVPRIGFLESGGADRTKSRLAAFQQGLQELGYVEGKNILIEQRFAGGKFERLPELAAELVRLKVDVIVAGGAPAAHAAKQVTTSIPIVMGNAADPVGTGLVQSLARPGGNVTGLSDFFEGVITKRLEILKEVVPTAKRVGVLLNPANPTNPVQFKMIQAVAPALGVALLPFEAREPDDINRAFTAMRKERAGALIVMGDPMLGSHPKRIVELTVKSRLPAIHGGRQSVQSGGLMSYGTSFENLYRRAAVYVDKILRGAKPADLPIEQPTKFEFVVNLKAAKQIGLTIPPNLLARADRVIK